MKCEKETMLLYAVTDRMWTGKQTLMEQVEDALKGGATCVQLREKELDEENFLKEAIEMKALCAKYGVPFIVNDNVEIAIKCKADGIHVGQSDMEAGNVRALVGEDMIIGVSTKNVEQALAAQKCRLSGRWRNVPYGDKAGCGGGFSRSGAGNHSGGGYPCGCHWRHQ